MAAPGIELPETVRRRWERRLSGAARDWSSASSKDVGAIVREHALLPLVVDAGALLGLRADGVVVEVPWTATDRASPVADVRTRDIALVLGARRYPELAVLRPQRGSDDPDCAQCRGTGVFEASMPSIVCFCGGLGYLPSGWEADADEPERAAELVGHGEVSSAAVVSPLRRPSHADAETVGLAATDARPPQSVARVPISTRGTSDTDRTTPHASAATSRGGARIGALVLAAIVALLGAVAGVAWAGADGVAGRIELAIACGLGMLPGVLGGAWLGFRDD